MNSETIPPVPLDQTLVLINRFLFSTTAFLNDFALDCESRLSRISKKLEGLELQTQLLESKFSLQEILVVEPTQSSSLTSFQLTEEEELEEEEDEEEEEDRKLPENDATNHNSPQTQHIPSQNNIATTTTPLSSPKNIPPQGNNIDPRLLKYRSMVRVGIPREAVELKMKNDGVLDEIIASL